MAKLRHGASVSQMPQYLVTQSELADRHLNTIGRHSSGFEVSVDMRSGPYPAEAVSRHGTFAPLCANSRVLVLAMAVLGAAVSGCAPSFYDDDVEMARPRVRSESRRPLPRAALLAPQNAPDCGEAKADNPPVARDSKRMASSLGSEASSADVVPPNADTDRNAELALRIKLEYERECYRQAEIRVRNRLRQLQGAVGETIKAVDRAEQPTR